MKRITLELGDEGPDGVDDRRAQWLAELPDVDTGGMAILGRARLIARAMQAPVEDVFKRYGIDRGEADLLFTLLRSGPPYRLRPTELFKSLMISSGGVTFRLNRLEKKGLISRREEATDRRSSLVELTSEGARIAQSAFEEDMRLEAEMLGSLNEDEKLVLSLLMKKLLDKIGH